MYRSANASGILDKMKFIQNGVDEVRRNTTIKVDMHNNGGSFVKLPDSVATEDQNNQHLETVLLSDLVKTAKMLENPKQIIIKIDIELFECRTFLGSSNVINHPQPVPISAIIMEWVFKRNDGKFSLQCPIEKVKLMTKMFLKAGYVPFKTTNLSKLDYTNLGTEWMANVLWILNTTNTMNNIGSSFLKDM